MDFEKYIGKEKQLLSRLERERASINAYERRGNAGSLDYAEDELKLLDTVKLVDEHIARAGATMKMLDDRYAQLKELEGFIGKKNAQTQKHIEEWESSFDVRYNEMLKRVEAEIQSLELRNKEILAFFKAQEGLFSARSTEMAKAQKEFETSVSGKLEEDKQTIDRIKYMLSTMSEIIKS